MKLYRPHLQRAFMNRCDRKLGVMLDWRFHEALPTLDVYLWWFGVMLYWSRVR